MGPIVWFVAAIGLAIAEMAVMDFSLLMLGLAALVTAGVAIADVPTWVEVIVFGISAVLGLFVLRPVLRRRLQSSLPERSFSAGELVGSTATVVEAIPTQPGTNGMVRIAGELWSARPAHPGDSYDSGEIVEVLEIDGTTAVVWKGV